MFAFDALHLDGSGDDPCQPDSRGAEAYRGLPARGLVQAGAPGLLGANVCAVLKLNNGVPLTFPMGRSFVLYETEAELVAGNPPAVIVGVSHTVRGSPQSIVFGQTSLAVLLDSECRQPGHLWQPRDEGISPAAKGLPLLPRSS